MSTPLVAEPSLEYVTTILSPSMTCSTILANAIASKYGPTLRIFDPAGKVFLSVGDFLAVKLPFALEEHVSRVENCGLRLSLAHVKF